MLLKSVSARPRCIGMPCRRERARALACACAAGPRPISSRAARDMSLCPPLWPQRGACTWIFADMSTMLRMLLRVVAIGEALGHRGMVAAEP